MAVWAIQSKLVDSSFAVDEEDQELITPYKGMNTCLLENHATDEIIAEAYADVTDFRQVSAVTSPRSVSSCGTRRLAVVLSSQIAAESSFSPKVS